MMKKRVLMISFIGFFLFSNQEYLRAQEEQKEDSPDAKIESSPEREEKKETSRPNAMSTGKVTTTKFKDMRDPFKKHRAKRVKEKIRSKQQILVNGSYSNIPKLSTVSLDSIKIVGILLGEKKVAMAKIVGGKSGNSSNYILQEGMKVGENSSEIKAILPGGIVVVEKISNIYGQDEYFETIIPLHTGS